VKNRLHEGDVVRTGVIGPVVVVEELLAVGVLRLASGDRLVRIERLPQLVFRDAHLLRNLVNVVELLHETATRVVLRMPLDLLARLAVENEADRVFVVLVHAPGDCRERLSVFRR
jgi:hypothetical protein